MGWVKKTFTGIAFALILIAAALLMVLPGFYSTPQRKAPQQATETMFKTASIEARLFYDAFSSGMPIQAFIGFGQTLVCIERNEPDAEATCEKFWEMKATGNYDDIQSVLPHLLEHMNSFVDLNPYDNALPVYVAGPGSINENTPGTIELSIAPDSAIVIRTYLKKGQQVKLIEARVSPEGSGQKE